MQHKKKQSGFTLVELAIVMTIIGLLVGGILKGQELMQTARITATVAQIKAFEAAVTTFQDAYSAYPGDLPNAETRLPGCNGGCTPLAASAGDGVVGAPDWATGGTWANQGTVTLGTGAPTNVDNETYLFWAHLVLANLIGGVTDEGVRNPINYAWGSTHPYAKVNGGGFVVGTLRGFTQPGSPLPASTAQGLSLVFQSTPTSNVAGNDPSGSYPLSAGRAAQIDRKMDDGRPAVGYVQAYGIVASCFQDAVDTAYVESIEAQDCGLIFRIQG